MKILVAEDDRVSRLLLETHLKRWGHEPVTTPDGAKAWDVLQREDPPTLAILDWMMPGLDGVEVCRRARRRTAVRPLYIILLTGARARGPASRDPTHLLVLHEGAERQRFLAAGGGVRERPFRRPLQPRGVPGVREERAAALAGRVEAGARLASEP